MIDHQSSVKPAFSASKDVCGACHACRCGSDVLVKQVQAAAMRNDTAEVRLASRLHLHVCCTGNHRCLPA